MGGSASTSAAIAKATEQARKEQIEHLEEDIMAFVMPIFYSKAPLTAEEREAANAVWKMIVNNKAPQFLELRTKHAGDPSFPHVTCLEYWYDVFYNRLFDVHPSCKVLFKKSINKQGSFFARMLGLLLGDIDDQEKWRKNLENLAHIHNKMGVKAVEYGIVGEVVLYAIRQCVGDAAYTPVAHRGWTKIYSRILDMIIPIVVHFELQNKIQSQQIAEKRGAQVGIQGSMFVETTKHSSAAQASLDFRSTHSGNLGSDSGSAYSAK